MKYVSTQDLSAFDNFFNDLKALEKKKVAAEKFRILSAGSSWQVP